MNKAEKAAEGQKQVLIDVIQARISYFQKIYHWYEADQLKSALTGVRDLIPPENFNQSPTPEAVAVAFGELPTREQLISICERAIVPQDKWKNRDSESAQQNVGRVWQLLKCGCEFKVITDKDDKSYHSTDSVWIIKFWVRNFSWFEYGSDDPKGYEKDSSGEYLQFYIPTDKSLQISNGQDWY